VNHNSTNLVQKIINVLVFPCGGENGIEIHYALKDTVNIKLFGASGKEDHGVFIYKNYFGNIPYVTDKRFIEYFNHILTNNNIDIVLPTHDDISLYLANNLNYICANIAVPGLMQAKICRSKKETYELFKDESFCPQVYKDISEIKKYPVFAKPDQDQGGKGGIIINDISEINIHRFFCSNYVFTEYLPGEESTVDCFTDRHGLLRFIGPRKRNRVFGGISVNSSTQPVTEEIKDIASTINRKIKMRGLWFFQIKKDNAGYYKLLEISVRTAGSMNLYRGLGVNFPLLTVYDLMEQDVEILCNDYSLIVDRSLMNKYKSDLIFDTIYIDFDDTITKNGLVNPQVISFLYNAKNNNKRIILLTKHISDLSETLDLLSIHQRLFDEIIQLGSNDFKYSKITKTSNAIFIDNAFKERAEVKRILKIPVFDVDAIPTLIDWKE
jgi:hypothetical protein